MPPKWLPAGRTILWILGLGVGVFVGRRVAVGVAVGVPGVGDDVHVAVALGVGVVEAVDVNVALAVALAVDVNVAVALGVSGIIGVGRTVAVWVGEGTLLGAADTAVGADAVRVAKILAARADSVAAVSTSTVGERQADSPRTAKARTRIQISACFILFLPNQWTEDG